MSPGQIMKEDNLFLLGSQAMIERGDATVKDIDSAMMLGAGNPMGPIQLADYVGTTQNTHTSADANSTCLFWRVLLCGRESSAFWYRRISLSLFLSRDEGLKKTRSICILIFFKASTLVSTSWMGGSKSTPTRWVSSCRRFSAPKSPPASRQDSRVELSEGVVVDDFRAFGRSRELKRGRARAVRCSSKIFSVVAKSETLETRD